MSNIAIVTAKRGTIGRLSPLLAQSLAVHGMSLGRSLTDQ